MQSDLNSTMKKTFSVLQSGEAARMGGGPGQRAPGPLAYAHGGQQQQPATSRLQQIMRDRPGASGAGASRPHTAAALDQVQRNLSPLMHQVYSSQSGGGGGAIASLLARGQDQGQGPGGNSGLNLGQSNAGARVAPSPVASSSPQQGYVRHNSTTQPPNASELQVRLPLPAFSPPLPSPLFGHTCFHSCGSV